MKECQLSPLKSNYCVKYAILSHICCSSFTCIAMHLVGHRCWVWEFPLRWLSQVGSPITKLNKSPGIQSGLCVCVILTSFIFYLNLVWVILNMNSKKHIFHMSDFHEKVTLPFQKIDDFFGGNDVALDFFWQVILKSLSLRHRQILLWFIQSFSLLLRF